MLASLAAADKDALAFLPEGGEMGALIRRFDWSSSPLGRPQDWPQSLKTAAGIVLSSKLPMFVAWGPDLRFIYNDGYAEILGGKHPAALGHAFEDIWAELWEDVKPIAHQALGGESTYSEDMPLTMTRNGFEEQTWFTFSYTPVRDEADRIAGIFCACIETTATVKAERQRRESEERFRLIADSAPVPMWVTRLDRKRSFVNIAYAEFLGVSYQEALDFDWRARIHPEDFERVVAESLAGEATLRPFVLEARYLRGDFAWRWLRSESQPRWGPNGEHIGFIGVAHDITAAKEAEAKLREANETLERRVAERTGDLSQALDRLQAEVAERLRAEDALRQAQKMEAVGQLTGGIAHDFNNLLTPIMGGLEIIASRVTDERLKRMSETALESARRGAKLTGQLLAFSRIQRISMAPVPVNEVIEGMKDLLRHTIGRGVSIETKLDPEVTHGVCDANQLENAVLNLAINARDAMPAGGTLTISTGRTSISNQPEVEDGDYVCVSVADTGEGMSAEVLARATEPFFSTKPLGKGTGLGLAQVYGIARQSGGTVRIESEPGRGTVVHLLLRAASADPAGDCTGLQITGGGVPEPARHDATVVVIDDDADVRSFLAESLRSLGYGVVEADCGAAGLERIEQAAPALVLLDYAMPGMNGAEVARTARERRPDLPIVFVTGYAESEQLEAALGPAVPVLRKPFTIAQLAAIVEEQIPAAPAG